MGGFGGEHGGDVEDDIDACGGGGETAGVGGGNSPSSPWEPSGVPCWLNSWVAAGKAVKPLPCAQCVRSKQTTACRLAGTSLKGLSAVKCTVLQISGGSPVGAPTVPV